MRRKKFCRGKKTRTKNTNNNGADFFINNNKLSLFFGIGFYDNFNNNGRNEKQRQDPNSQWRIDF